MVGYIDRMVGGLGHMPVFGTGWHGNVWQNDNTTIHGVSRLTQRIKEQIKSQKE